MVKDGNTLFMMLFGNKLYIRGIKFVCRGVIFGNAKLIGF